MSKRTPGERLAQNLDPFENYIGRDLVRVIDRAFRREKAKAWDECCDVLSLTQTDKELARYSNPYRGRKK